MQRSAAVSPGHEGRRDVRAGLACVAERHGPGGPAGLQNSCGRVAHGSVGSTPAPLRQAKSGGFRRIVAHTVCARESVRLPLKSAQDRVGPAGPQSEVARCVRQSHRAGGQHRRDRLPDTPPRPAGVVLSRSAIRPEQHRRLRESLGISLEPEAARENVGGRSARLSNSAAFVVGSIHGRSPEIASRVGHHRAAS